jgi:hypothetical protein
LFFVSRRVRSDTVLWLAVVKQRPLRGNLFIYLLLLKMLRYILSIFSFLLTCAIPAQRKQVVKLSPVDKGWSANSINTVIFRKNSLVTHKGIQYIAYYNQEQHVVIGKRKTGDSLWLLNPTLYKGRTTDAHNSISIMVDDAGYLHMTWDHHGNQLNYCRTVSPGSLELTNKLPMTGLNEEKVTYPEFYKLTGGKLLFFYRDGASGKGNLVLNCYDTKTSKWSQLHSNLVDGGGQRSAYWQAFVDAKGIVHISWVWRETPDVASNHDMCYARSSDGGKTWTNSTGKKYQLPITAATAEYACRIPQGSELINQTSMYADATGRPFIASYWKEVNDSVPQYHIIYKSNAGWKTANLGFRKTAFSLKGEGTKRIPISRPQIVATGNGNALRAILLFRDAERGNKVSAAICNDLSKSKWNCIDLDTESVGSWEPTYDTELWKQKNILNLFVQETIQADAEGQSGKAPQLVKVLEWKPVF